jgi:drug/metabolite transporter superfamily protein YnfA
LTKRLKTSDESQRLDVAIGLTEGFVADLGKSRAAGESESAYGLVGTYVESPLRWAISTGKEREDVRDVEGLKGSRVGVSRVGS